MNLMQDDMAPKVKVTFLCDQEIRDELEKLADDEGRSISNLVERLVLEALDNRKK